MTLSSITVFPSLRQQLPFDLAWLPDQAYLVGGAVRDRLLGRQRDYLDWDFVVPENAIKTAKAIAEHYQAGFVVLDKEREIARVVFPKGTVDFALREGLTLEQDLQRRDFTINGIAYNLHQETLIDPLNGVKDIQKKQLKMISKANLADDPLRLLRA
ncbi:MAG: CCA tRNA nucleotidyltransferase, partial [Microcystaceae cyanobacterium]